MSVVIKTYGPFLSPDFNTAPKIEGTQKGTLILTTTHVHPQRGGRSSQKDKTSNSKA